MIAIHTNGKLEYNYFCPKNYADRITKWCKSFDGFILQNKETIFAEIFPKEGKANFFFSTIPSSKRRDFANRICDTTFAALDVKYNEKEGKDDFELFKSALLMYDRESGYTPLGIEFDSIFTEEFFNDFTNESVHNKTTYELVESRLRDIHQILIDKISDKNGVASELEENQCRILPVENDRTNFVATLENATKDTNTDKIILLITSMSVNEEKIKKLFDTQDDTTVKALVYSTNAKTEQPSIEIKKKANTIPNEGGNSRSNNGINNGKSFDLADAISLAENGLNKIGSGLNNFGNTIRKWLRK